MTDGDPEGSDRAEPPGESYEGEGLPSGIDDVQLDRAVDALRSADEVVAFTGAGVSTESGVPDFRSSGGIWDEFDPRDFTLEAVREDPVGYWERRLAMRESFEFDWAEVDPNPAHEAIARLDGAGKLSTVVTQNVDGLHQEAGHDPEDVLELHGTRRRAKCVDCDRRLPIEDLEARVDPDDLPPACEECGGVLRRATVLFGERLPQDVLRRAESAATRCDCLLVVGSSLTVEPAASLPRVALRSGADVVIVNLEPTGLEDRATAFLQGKAGRILPTAVERALDS